MPRKFSDGFLDHAKSLIDNGSTATEASQIMGCCRDALCNALRRRHPGYNPAINRGQRCPNRMDGLPELDIIARYRSGISEKALSAEFGVSRAVINRVLAKHNVARRTRSSAMYVRMSNMTESERSDLASAAHARVRTLPREHFVRSATKRAASVESGNANIAIGPGEQEIFNRLVTLGYSPTWQKALDQYSIDIAFNSVAVEVRWRGSGRMKALTQGNRLEKIMEANLKMALVVLIDDAAIESGLDDVIALLQVIDRKPSTGRKYWVIRSGLQTSPITRFNGHKSPDVVAPPELVTSIRECYAR